MISFGGSFFFGFLPVLVASGKNAHFKILEPLRNHCKAVDHYPNKKVRDTGSPSQ